MHIFQFFVLSLIALSLVEGKKTCYCSICHHKKFCHTHGTCYNATDSSLGNSHGCIDRALTRFVCNRTFTSVDQASEEIKCCDAFWCNANLMIAPQIFYPLFKVNSFEWRLAEGNKELSLRFKTQNTVRSDIRINFIDTISKNSTTVIFEYVKKRWEQISFENNTLYKIEFVPLVNGVPYNESLRHLFFMNLYKHDPIWFMNDSSISESDPNQIFCGQCMHLVEHHKCRDCVRYDYQEFLPLPARFFT